MSAASRRREDATYGIIEVFSSRGPGGKGFQPVPVREESTIDISTAYRQRRVEFCPERAGSPCHQGHVVVIGPVVGCVAWVIVEALGSA